MAIDQQLKKRRRFFFVSLLCIVLIAVVSAVLIFVWVSNPGVSEVSERPIPAPNLSVSQKPDSRSTGNPIPESPLIELPASEIPQSAPPAPLASPTPTTDQLAPVNWYYMKRGSGFVPDFPLVSAFRPEQQVVWTGTSPGSVYLTIDMGADLGDPPRWLDILRKHHVKATYFVTGENIRRSPDLIRNLVAEGHIVANHSLSHPDFSTLTDDEVRGEIEQTAALYEQATGLKPTPLFRFPYGTYSDHLLSLVTDMGYTSVFWSTAMKDWVPRENGASDVLNDVLGNLHDGNIILMHQASADNLNALDSLLGQIKQRGYRFALVGE